MNRKIFLRLMLLAIILLSICGRSIVQWTTVTYFSGGSRYYQKDLRKELPITVIKNPDYSKVYYMTGVRKIIYVAKTFPIVDRTVQDTWSEYVYSEAK
jgi:hypothetical protein